MPRGKQQPQDLDNTSESSHPLHPPQKCNNPRQAPEHTPAVTEQKATTPRSRGRVGPATRTQPSQSKLQGSHTRGPCAGQRIPERANPADPRKGKGPVSGRRDSRQRAPSTPKPELSNPKPEPSTTKSEPSTTKSEPSTPKPKPSTPEPHNMARGGSQNWSSGESDGQPEEQTSQETG